MVDTRVICPTCGDSVRADEFAEGKTLVCDRCVEDSPSDESDEEGERLRERDGWDEVEQQRWPSRRRRQRR